MFNRQDKMSVILHLCKWDLSGTGTRQVGTSVVDCSGVNPTCFHGWLTPCDWKSFLLLAQESPLRASGYAVQFGHYWSTTSQKVHPAVCQQGAGRAVSFRELLWMEWGWALCPQGHTFDEGSVLLHIMSSFRGKGEPLAKWMPSDTATVNS